MRRAAGLASVLVFGLLAAAFLVPAAVGAVFNVSMGDNFFAPQNVKVALGDTVNWRNDGINPHTTASTNTNVKNPNGTSGIALWKSPVVSTGGQFQRVLRFSGRFPYYCEIHEFQMKGTVVVPMKVAKAAVTGGTRITATWSTVTPPTGLVFDVQRKLAGSSTFQNWQTGVTTKMASFVTSTAGTYSFRSRVRRPATGGVSLFTDPKPINVP